MSIEQERIAHINHLMEDIHDSTNSIYEFLIDRDFVSLCGAVSHQISVLEDLRNSIEEEA
jgi:hypothetical protein